jgi:hypothetical protein
VNIVIPEIVLQVVGIWVLIGTVVMAIMWVPALIKFSRLEGDQEVIPGMTKDVVLALFQHMIYEHGSTQGAAVLVGMALALLWMIITWPRILWKRIKPPSASC